MRIAPTLFAVIIAALISAIGVATFATGPDPLFLRFKGHYRSAPKTTMASLPTESPDTIAAIRQMVPADPQMRTKYSNPDISDINKIHDPTWLSKYNHRLDEELYLVEVTA